MQADATLDATHLRCPLPVLRARKALAGMAPGQVLRVLATDPMAAVDLPHFAAEAGHAYLGAAAAGAATAHYLRRGPGG
jgi:tRNA 2-thiouridine synthesizing protein A